MASKRNLTGLLLISDMLALGLAFVIGQGLRLPDFDGSVLAWWLAEGQYRLRALLLTFGLLLMVLGGIKQHYSRRKPFWDELRDTLLVLLVLAVADAAFMFLNKWQFSRIAFGSQWLAVFLLVPGLRLALKETLLRQGRWQLPVVLIGSGPNGREAWLALRSERLMGHELMVVVAPPGGQPASWLHEVQAGVCQLAWEDAQPLLAAGGARQVVVALEADEQRLVETVMRRISSVCQEALLVPPTRGLPLLGVEPLHAFSHEALLLRTKNNLQRPVARWLKRSFDLVVSVLLLLLLLPLFLYLVLQVRASGGNAFYGHVRVGRNGRSFPCYKFRTMVPNSREVLEQLLRESPVAKAEWEREFKLKDDPRITPIGDFLRRTSLDELPQLWNVLKGEMSLVGPRPVVQDELAKYGEDVSYYLQVRPGMTGLWQVSGRNDVDYEKRVALDAWYVRNWSLWNDIVILIMTTKAVLRRDGAY